MKKKKKNKLPSIIKANKSYFPNVKDTEWWVIFFFAKFKELSLIFKGLYDA